MAKFCEVFERIEKKYRLSAEQYQLMKAALQGHMTPDRYGRMRITSLYFDTPDRSLIARSLEKPRYKEKLRLRMYGSEGEVLLRPDGWCERRGSLEPSMVITLVNGNLGAGIAVMGVFNLVRFRSIPGSAKDIGTVFLAMAVGLATGMGFIALGVLFTAIVAVANIAYVLSPFGKPKEPGKTLKITVPED